MKRLALTYAALIAFVALPGCTVRLGLILLPGHHHHHRAKPCVFPHCVNDSGMGNPDYKPGGPLSG